MPTLTLTFNQANADRMEAAFTERLGRTATGVDIKDHAIENLKDFVRNVERDIADQARDAADDPVVIT